MSVVFGYIDSIGRRLIQNIIYIYNVLLLIYLSIRAAIVDQAQGARTVFQVVSSQIYFTGWQAMPIITVLALASGGVVIIQAQLQLSLLGGSEMIGKLLVAIIVREIGPLICALIVIARSGTAVASEIGTMKVNREIEALESLGINPLSYIVFPRLAGGIISLVCMAFYFNAIALIGGYVLTRLFSDLPLAFFIDSLVYAVTMEDFLLFLIKNVFNGAVIFVICCYQGLLVNRSPHEVPQATTKAVVHSIIIVTVFNLALTFLFYLNQLMKIGVI